MSIGDSLIREAILHKLDCFSLLQATTSSAVVFLAILSFNRSLQLEKGNLDKMSHPFSKRKRSSTTKASSKDAEATISGLYPPQNAPKRQKSTQSLPKAEEIAESASHPTMESFSNEAAQNVGFIIELDDDNDDDDEKTSEMSVQNIMREVREILDRQITEKTGHAQKEQQSPRVLSSCHGWDCCLCREWVPQLRNVCNCKHERCRDLCMTRALAVECNR